MSHIFNLYLLLAPLLCRKSILSIIFYAIYRAVRFQLTCFSSEDCENICSSS